MSIITTIKTIDRGIKELESLQRSYDPGAGLKVWVGNPERPLELQLAHGEPVLQQMLASLRQSHLEMLALARIELRELQDLLKDR